MLSFAHIRHGLAFAPPSYAQDVALGIRTDGDVDRATQGMMSGELSHKRGGRSLEWRARQNQRPGSVPRDEREEDELLRADGLRANHGRAGADGGRGEFGSSRQTAPGAWGGHGVVGDSSVLGNHLKRLATSPPREGHRKDVKNITPYPVVPIREEMKERQETKDAAWERRVNDTIFDLRGQSLGVETSPWLARFMLDERRLHRIKHVVMSGSFVDPAFCLDLCRIITHVSGVVTLEMSNCGLKTAGVQPLCMLIHRENMSSKEDSGEARRNLLNAKNRKLDKKKRAGTISCVRGAVTVEKKVLLMASSKNLNLAFGDESSRISQGPMPEKAATTSISDGLGLDGGVLRDELNSRRKLEVVAMHARVMLQFNFTANGLQELKIGGNRIGDRGMIMLAGVLEQDLMIRILDISRTGFGEHGAVALGGAMENMASLQWLSMEWNLIGSGRGAQAIGAGLRNSYTLKCLDISDCSLGDKGGSYIVAALADNETLEELDLGNNRLSRDTAEVLADALHKNSTLRSLQLVRNPLGFEGAGELVRAMMVNTVLRVLNLSHCSFMKRNNTTDDISFDENRPAGHYRLNLSLPGQYIIAAKLVELWKQQGSTTWRNVTLNTRRFVLKEEERWPKRMPQKGTLVLDFVPNEHRGKNTTVAISHDDFEELWCQILHPGVPMHEIGQGADKIEASDEWMLSYAGVLAQSLYFTASQVAQMVKSLSWSDNRVKLVVAVFGRVFDFDNIGEIENVLKASEWSRALTVLGLQSSYHPQNLTGSYSLNLARSVDYMIVMRLRDSYLKQSAMEEGQGVVVKPDERRPCWRNVKLNFKSLRGPAEFGVGPIHLADLQIPTQGVLSLDFVSFAAVHAETKSISVTGFSYVMDVLKQPLRGSSNMTRQVTRDIRMGTTTFLDKNFIGWKNKPTETGLRFLAGKALTGRNGNVPGSGPSSDVGVPVANHSNLPGDGPPSYEHAGPEIETISLAALEQVVREECDGKSLSEVAVEVVVRPRGDVFNVEDTADCCYFVLEGTAMAYVSRKVDTHFEDAAVTTYVRGHFINDEAVCRDRIDSVVTVRAAGNTPLTLLRIPKESMLAVMCSPGEAGRAIAQNAKRRELFFLEEANEHFNDVTKRLAVSALPQAFDPLAPEPIGLEQLVEALILNGFSPKVMEVSVEPGNLITESGKPSMAAYYIIQGSVRSTSVWADSCAAAVTADDGGEDHTKPNSNSDGGGGDYGNGEGGDESKSEAEAEGGDEGSSTSAESGAARRSQAGSESGFDEIVRSDGIAGTSGAGSSAAAPGVDAAPRESEGDNSKPTAVTAAAATAAAVDNVEGTIIMCGLIVGLIPFTLDLKEYVSSARAVGTAPVRLLVLKPQHIQALLKDPDLAPKLRKYAAAYTIKSAQGRAMANAAAERELAAARHDLDAALLAERKALHGPEARLARMQLVRSLAVSFSFTCVNAVQLLGSGAFTESCDRVELVQAMWVGLRDRATFFYIIFQALTSTQQMMLGRCLGYANFVVYKVPQGRYQLRMHMLDEFQVAHRLAKMASMGGQSANWDNLHIDGKRKAIPEDNKFWTYISTTKNGLKMLPGEKNRSLLEFDFDMSGAEVCNGHVLRLQARWRGFVVQRQHQRRKYAALILQYMFRSLRAMRFMREATATLEAQKGQHEASTGPVGGGVAQAQARAEAGKVFALEGVRTFTAHLMMLQYTKANSQLREEYRIKGMGHPLTMSTSTDVLKQANRDHVAAMRRIKDLSGIVSFVQKSASQTKLTRDKRSTVGIQGLECRV